MKKRFAVISAAAICAASLSAVAFGMQHTVTLTAVLQTTTTPAGIEATTPSDARIAATVPTPTPLPISATNHVPYTMQAPFNKWDPLHEDACEETSLIMVKHFLDHTQISSPDQADQEITGLITWEQVHGYGPSITLEQLNQIAKDYYGLNNGKVVQISTVDDIKPELANAHPVIVGLAGKQLPNPYFSNGGPNYHMLTVTGYDASGFITNEPGTWHGDGFHYAYAPFYSAIHDWNATSIQQGQKAYLVFE